MLSIFVAAFTLITLIFGGDIRNIEKTALRGLWLPMLSLLLQPLTVFLCERFLGRFPYFHIGMTLSYAAAFVFILINRSERLFFWPALAGGLSNFLVIAANDFYMPVSRSVLAMSGFTSVPLSKQLSYIVANADARLIFLGDVIYFPWPQGFASIGDVLLTGGVCVLIYKMLKPKKK